MNRKESILSVFLCLLCLLIVCYLEYTFPTFSYRRGSMRPSNLTDKQTSQEPYLPKEEQSMSFREPEWAASEVYVEMDFAKVGDEIVFCEPYQRPGFTAGETLRARKLIAAFQEGAYEGASILNKKNDVILGVYSLDPTKWDGEQAYVLLPCTCLTDEQILAIIDAYHQLGLEFNPEELNYRNCSRGGNATMTRQYTAEEKSQYETVEELFQNGDKAGRKITCVWTAYTENIHLMSEYFCGVRQFELVPYCRLTKEELAAKLLLNEP